MQVCVFYMYMCQYVCVWYVGKRDWTFQHYCWRFRVKPWGEMGREAGTPTYSVSCLPKPRLWDRRDAFVWLGGGHEARQAGAFVRSLCVCALPVLTQRHFVADVLTLVYVWGERTQHELVSRENPRRKSCLSAAEGSPQNYNSSLSRPFHVKLQQIWVLF